VSDFYAIDDDAVPEVLITDRTFSVCVYDHLCIVIIFVIIIIILIFCSNLIFILDIQQIKIVFVSLKHCTLTTVILVLVFISAMKTAVTGRRNKSLKGTGCVGVCGWLS